MEAIDGATARLHTFARGELLDAVSHAKNSVRLASPFITRPIAADLVAASNSGAETDLKLLTALVAGSVQVRALDPEALRLLRNAGWQIGSIRNLHAKVSLVDSRWALVGSGNLTNAGLGSTERGNVELGVTLRPAQIDVAIAIYDRWWEEARTVTEEELDRFAAMPRKTGKGAEEGVGPALEIPDPVDLETILGQEDPVRRYWVKANYHRRNEDGRGWWNRGWISDWRKASYREGDLILLYLGAKYDGPRRCPVIVRVTAQARHDPQFMADHGDPESKERWPWVTDISCVYEVPVLSGAPLSAFDVTARGLQGGYKELSRAQFETAASYLLSVPR